jgi:hypothetical protein
VQTFTAYTRETAAVRRLTAQGLVTPFGDLTQAAQTLIGVQAQMLPAAALALALRTAQLTAADVHTALFAARSLIRLWGQRHTLHLYAAADWPLIYAAQADQPTYFAREAQQRGESLNEYQQLLSAVAALLRERGILGRSDLRGAGLPLTAAHLNGWGGVFSDLARRGLACHAEAGSEARMAHREYWLPELEWHPPTTDAANCELLRRYLHAFGPADAHDIALWRGRPLRDVRRWLAMIGDELLPVSVDGRPALLLQQDAQVPTAAAAELPPLLLGRFDQLLLAYADRTTFLAAEHQRAVRRPAGHLEATIWQHGRVIGTWRSDRRTDGLLVTLRPFRRLTRRQLRDYERLAARIAQLVGLPLAVVQQEHSDE